MAVDVPKRESRKYQITIIIGVFFTEFYVGIKNKILLEKLSRYYEVTYLCNIDTSLNFTQSLIVLASANSKPSLLRFSTHRQPFTVEGNKGTTFLL